MYQKETSARMREVSEGAFELADQTKQVEP